ncbi:spaetzle domain-containing protein 6 isoform X2 [Choristoneura fumiferana]|uniref:spaetzle domain-containing protein 6 isoform X2 n=1 Tax=Choristoneura fumiferana TaxID=7141 RepID=UPI003D1588B9
MTRQHLVCLALLLLAPLALPEPTSPAPDAAPAQPRADDDEPPEGYYAFVESPNATPPRVRPPPYRQVAAECPSAAARAHVSAHNLCGDLNRGLIPRNPMGQNPNGEPYPFELLRNHTLRFLSRTLPVLRADDTLPRVAHVSHANPPHAQHATHAHLAQQDTNSLEERMKRSVSEALSGAVPDGAALEAEHRSEAPRESRKFCDGGGVFCMLYRAINGESSSAGVERREDPGPAPHASAQTAQRYEGPPTPCPARVEYATPVFARNYQGVWRYVVQIPYEGYFTQTVEVTRCMQSRCHYLDGGCLSSPRWVSLLVGELHYPAPAAPAPAAGATPTPTQQARPYNDQQYQEYQQYLQKRAGAPADAPGAAPDKPAHCDGHDEMGCFQVRLYYDWFLVPGSCKCWRPDYFARYVRRRNAGEL